MQSAIRGWRRQEQREDFGCTQKCKTLRILQLEFSLLQGTLLFSTFGPWASKGIYAVRISPSERCVHQPDEIDLKQVKLKKLIQPHYGISDSGDYWCETSTILRSIRKRRILVGDIAKFHSHNFRMQNTWETPHCLLYVTSFTYYVMTVSLLILVQFHLRPAGALLWVITEGDLLALSHILLL